MRRHAFRAFAVLCTAALFAGSLTLATARSTGATGSATIQVLLTDDRVWNLDNGWGDGAGIGTATLTIARGGVQAYPASGDPAVTAAIGGGQFRFALFPGNGGPYEFDIQPGDVVTVADTAGHSATTTVVDLTVTGVDADSRVVSGTAPGGNNVQVDAVNRDTSEACTKTVGSDGTWSAAFTDCNPDIPFVHPNPPGVNGTSGGAYVFDGGANATYVDWTVAPVQPPAQLIVNRPNNIEGWNFAAGGTADVEVFASQGAGSPLATTNAPIGGDGRFSAFFGSLTLEPGMWVVATDGTMTKDVVVSELQVWGSDAAAGTVYGSAAPSSTVTVKTLGPQGCWRDVTADGTGYWIVDFSQVLVPGDCTVAVPFELPTQEPGVQWGTNGDAFQTDGDGDWTGHALWNPSWIIVSASMDWVAGVGASFRPDHDVTVTIDDPATGQNPDVSLSATTAPGWPLDFRLCTAPGSQVGQGDCTAVGGPFDIQPGFLVTVTDGTTSKSEIVTAVDVTNVDPSASTVSGTAAPNSSVLVTAGGPNGPGSRTATANGAGAWSVDFSQAQGNEQPLPLSPGTGGFVYQTELTGTVDGDETAAPWGVPFFSPPTLDVVPDADLLDGQHVNLSGQNWPANGTLLVSECVLGYPFGLDTPLPCDPSTKQSYPTGPDGNASGSFTVTRTITTDASGTVDCATVQNGCGLLGVVWHSGVEGDIGGGITLDYPDQNPIQFQRTTFAVTPSTGLVEGQLVTISGAGWPANRTMDITECAAQLSLGVDSCDGTTTQHLTTGPDGTVSGQFRVSRSILTQLTGPYDCAVDPTRCGLVAVVWHGTPGDPSQGISLAMPQDHLLAFKATTDHAAPSITIKSPSDGATVAEHKVLRATYSCADTGGSGLASCVGDVANGSNTDTSAVGAHTFTVVARDRAGNLAVRSVHYTVIDQTPPTVSLNLPTSGATYAQGQVVIASYTCSDSGSGISTCAGTAPSGSAIDTGSIGSKSFKVTAIDNSGNQAQVTASYLVVYAWNGFFRPANTALAEPPTANPAAGTPGTTLSVWFDLGGDRGPSSVVKSAKVQRVECGSGAPMGKATSATGTVAFDQTAGRYRYQWATKTAWAGQCQQLQLTLTDGTTHAVNFHF